MKYKVGDKIKIVRATFGCCGAEGKIGVITNKPAIYGLTYYKDGFNVDCGDEHVWRIGFDSECELLDELTAEEAIRLKSEMCENSLCEECKFYKRNNGEDIFCNEFSQKHPEQVVEALKQWKKDHETEQNKEEQNTEIVEIVDLIKIMFMKEVGNDEMCIYTYEIDISKEDVDEKMEELVKKYYEKYGDKIYAKYEHICRIKCPFREEKYYDGWDND